MKKAIQAVDVRIEDERFYAVIEGGREMGVPYSLYPYPDKQHQAKHHQGKGPYPLSNPGCFWS